MAACCAFSPSGSKSTLNLDAMHVIPNPRSVDCMAQNHTSLKPCLPTAKSAFALSHARDGAQARDLQGAAGFRVIASKLHRGGKAASLEKVGICWNARLPAFGLSTAHVVQELRCCHLAMPKLGCCTGGGAPEPDTAKEPPKQKQGIRHAPADFFRFTSGTSITPP